MPHSHALVNHEITGTVRWLDVDLARVVIHVEDTDSHAGRFLGTDTTVNLADAHLQGIELPELTPGVRLRVKLRLPGDQGAKVPELVDAHSVYVG